MEKQQTEISIRYQSAPNIALIKYWGKYDQDEILPINDSLGLTLNTSDLSTTTICTFSKKISQDQFWLNGKKVDVGKRMLKVLDKIRKFARRSNRFESMTDEEWNLYHFKIESQNSFPTASGMASSASGFSCLATALNGLFGNILDEKEQSRLARWGSGSAARAVYGGLVKWEGVEQHHLKEKHLQDLQLQILSKKCISYSIKPAQQLSYIKIIILLTQNKEKEVSSTVGMKTTLETSQFIHHRNKIAKQRISKIQSILIQIDKYRKSNNILGQHEQFSKLAQLIMRDSNQFHALCLDTYPPIFYLNEFSRSIISIVDNIINKQNKKCKIAYSFDAGAHAFIFLHESMLPSVLQYLNQLYQFEENQLNQKAKKALRQIPKQTETFSQYKGKIIKPTSLWITDAGKGAQSIGIVQ